MQVIDNFFPEEMFRQLQRNVLGPNMPWYYVPTISAPPWLQVDDPMAKETDGMQCVFYDKDRNLASAEYMFLRQYFLIMLEKLGYTENNLLRVRASLKWPKPGITSEYYNIPHIDSASTHKTIVFYLNDADGDTRLFHQRQDPNTKTLHSNPSDEEKMEYAKQFIKSGFTIEHSVTPKANRLLMFDGLQYHTAGMPVNSDRRVIFNINLNETK